MYLSDLVWNELDVDGRALFDLASSLNRVVCGKPLIAVQSAFNITTGPYGV